MKVVIIGAGMSGLCMGIQLKRAGIDFEILEKASEVGGTWWFNRYPGCACDIPSALYSYSFEPNPDWSKVWADQPEILAYLKHCVAKYGLRDHIRFDAQARAASFNEDTLTWWVSLEGGNDIEADVLINATGPLHRPRLPEIEGIETFEGAAFHSAQWDPSVDLSGKRVAVVGSAASAVQIIPKIASQCAELFVFQRTANYVMPKANRRYSTWTKRVFRHLPALQQMHRMLFYWRQELMFGLLFTPDRVTAPWVEALIRRQIAAQVSDSALLNKVMPTYGAGCKRILIDSDYYSTLQQDHVTLVTDSIQSMEARGIRAGERRYEVDVVVYATGFDVMDRRRNRQIRGRGGKSIDEVFGNAPRTYLGMTLTGFPNLFMLMGPNTGLGHNSVVWMMERQVEHIVKLLQEMRRREVDVVEADPFEVERFQRYVASQLKDRVWVKGQCNSWYQNEDGQVFALWPGHTFTYASMVRRAGLDDYFSTSTSRAAAGVTRSISSTHPAEASGNASAYAT